MSYECIEVTCNQSVATLALNRPDRLNALSLQTLGEIRTALDRVARDREVRAILLTGNGRAFCSGADLVEAVDVWQLSDNDLGAFLEQNYAPVIRGLRRIEKPVVCAVNGIAVGAGMSLALAADIVLAARSAQFIQIFTKIGVIPDSGSTFFLPRLVGTARALGMALLGEPVSGAQAEQWGMIWRCVEDEELMPEANRLAVRLAAQPTQALNLAKRAFQASFGNGLDDQMDLENALQRVAGKTEDFVEGVTAFAEKRPPVFQGR